MASATTWKDRRGVDVPFEQLTTGTLEGLSTEAKHRKLELDSAKKFGAAEGSRATVEMIRSFVRE